MSAKVLRAKKIEIFGVSLNCVARRSHYLCTYCMQPRFGKVSYTMMKKFCKLPVSKSSIWTLL
jgi:hypothetical protein